VAKKRDLAEIYIHDGDYRNFEWYWDASDAMPGLDVFETLGNTDQNAFASRLRVWGDLAHGVLPSKTQVNLENADPLILAVKAGKYRFPVFHAAGTNTWIITRPYVKQSQQRDKRGDDAIQQAIKECAEYEKRTKEKRYYQRNRKKNA
jgi:hypothetical protein